MRKSFVPLLCVILIAAVSCQKEELVPAKRKGKLLINVGLSISVREIPKILKSSEETGSTEDFYVSIFSESGTEVLSFSSVSVMPDTIELDIGNYYVEAHSDNNLPAAFENPYYLGSSGIFSINSNEFQSVNVTCQLANTIVTVDYSDNIRSSFSDFRTIVSTALDSLLFIASETRKGYFRTLPMNIEVLLDYQLPDGTDTIKIISGRIPDPLPRRQYDILVDGSIAGGKAGFQLLLDSSEVISEIIEINDGSAGPPPVASGEIAYGDLLITEIMNNPSALSDSEGEWFEIYNASSSSLNLQNLILGRDDVNRHTITDSIILEPGGFFVLEKTDLATEVSGYVFGSGILLPNTGAVLYIWNEGTETEPGSLIFSLDYGAEGFPALTGSSLSLDPDFFSATDAVLASSWCAASSVYSTGDQGTPGTLNDECQ